MGTDLLILAEESIPPGFIFKPCLQPFKLLAVAIRPALPSFVDLFMVLTIHFLTPSQ